MSNDVEWRWADVDGVQHIVTKAELSSSLRSGQLPYYVLVWRTGWGSWYPACKLAELAAALPPGKAELPQTPAPGSTPEPPEPPLDRYATYQAREAASRLLGGGSKPTHSSPSAPPPPPPSAPSGASASAAAALMGKAASSAGARPPPPPTPAPPPVALAPPPPRNLPPPAVAAREPLPTIAEPPTESATLRPPGAVPPPPRAVPGAPVVPEPEGTPTVPLQGAMALRAAQGAQEVTPEPEEAGVGATDAVSAPEAAAPSDSAATSPFAAPPPATESAPDDGDDRSAPSEDRPRASAAAALLMASSRSTPPPPPPPPPRASTPPPPRASTPPPPRASTPPPSSQLPPMPAAIPARPPPLGLYLTLAVLGALAIVLVALLVRQRSTAGATLPVLPTAVEPATLGSDPAASSSEARACVLARQARRLAPAADPSVPITFAPGETAREVAMGFASSKKEARGLALDLQRLEVKDSFDARGTGMTAAIPIRSGGRWELRIDEPDDVIPKPRSLTGSIQIGAGKDGVVRRSSGAVEVLWPGGGGEPSTEPRMAPAEGGHALVLRRGGLAGKILLGWLDAEGRNASDLSPLAVDAAQVGSPAVAAEGKRALVAFASRSAEDAPWGLSLVVVDRGAPPGRARSFSLPPGGPGKEAIAPAVAALSGGRWLLQWTEGTSGRYQVRAQTLTGDLAPVGEAVTLSLEDANAGQGAIFARDDLAASLYLVKTEKGHELWGATLRCTP